MVFRTRTILIQDRSGIKDRVSSRSKDIGGIGTMIWNLRSVRFTEFRVSQYLRPTRPENCVGYPIGHNVIDETRGSAVKEEFCEGLQHVLFLSVGARVMLTRNIWQPKDLYNGALGTVKAVLYADGLRPQGLPKCILIEFHEYIGLSILAGEKFVLITPETVLFDPPSNITGAICQLPLVLG